MRSELLVGADERVEQRVILGKRAKVIPSGACSIVIPASSTTASPAASTSSNVSGAPVSDAPSVVKPSGSKPERSVKRQCSSERVGSGSAS